MKRLTSPELLAILQELEPEAGWMLCTDPVRQAGAQTSGPSPVRCNAHVGAKSGPLTPPFEVAFFPLMVPGVPIPWRTCSATGHDFRKAVAMALAGYRSQGWRPAPPPADQVVWRDHGTDHYPVITKLRAGTLCFFHPLEEGWRLWGEAPWAPCPAPQGSA